MPHTPNNSTLAKTPTELSLTILITVVSGKDAVRCCLKALYPQVNFEQTEIIVPVDKWSNDIGELALEFPEVNFHFIEDLGLAASDKISSHQHRLYDRRRAVGLNLSRGQIIAMTEDHAVPAEDWCEQILLLHEKSFQVIGGAIENSIDKPLNWAWYYCDFGRYGKPLKNNNAEYISDINVAYKREAIMSVRDIWNEAYHETTVHWELQKRDVKLVLDERMTVFQERAEMNLFEALRERINWGRVFAETRVNKMSLPKRFIYSVGAVFLPPVLLLRVFKNMLRQKRTFRQMVTTLPLAFLLLVGWSFGEMFGYMSESPQVNSDIKSVSNENSFVTDQPNVKSKLVT